MRLESQHLHNRHHCKVAKRHLDVALVQFLQQHGNVESAGTFRSGMTIRIRTVPSWKTLSPSCPDFQKYRGWVWKNSSRIS